MTDKEKIMQYLDIKGLSKNSFYKKTGFSVGFLDSGSSLLVEKLKVVIDNYHDINPMCFLDDEQPLIIDEKMLVDEDSMELESNSIPNTYLSDIQASAGFGDIINDDNALEELPKTYLPNAPNGLNVAFQVKGDSMHPTIRHYDYIAGNRVEDYKYIREGEVHVVVNVSNEVFCKRVYMDNDSIVLHSDNTVYKPYVMEKSDVVAIFRAFYRFSTDFSNANSMMYQNLELLKKELIQSQRPS